LFSTLSVNVTHHQNRLNFVTETEEKLVHSTIETSFFLKATKFSLVAVFTLQRQGDDFQSLSYSQFDTQKPKTMTEPFYKIGIASQRIFQLSALSSIAKNTSQKQAKKPKTLHKLNRLLQNPETSSFQHSEQGFYTQLSNLMNKKWQNSRKTLGMRRFSK